MTNHNHTTKVAGTPLGSLFQSLRGGLGAAGNPLSGSLRHLAGVKPGQAYFAKPWHYATRPAKTMLFPNFGPGLNTVRNAAVLYSVGSGAREMDRRVQEARSGAAAAAEAAQAGAGQAVLSRTTYPSLIASAARHTLGLNNRASDPIGSAEDALSTKIMQRGVSQGLRDWGNKSYSPIDAAAGLWAPVTKRVLAGGAGRLMDNSATLERDIAAETQAGVAPPTASPTGDTRAVDSAGRAGFGARWDSGRKWLASRGAEIAKKIVTPDQSGG